MDEGGKELLLIRMNDVQSALHLTALNGHEATVLLLIETGGKDLLFVTATDGGTVLHQAASNGHLEVARLLIEAGGQRLLFLTDEDSVSPLHYAACYGHVDVLRMLIERGCTRLLASKTNRGETAEDITMRCGQVALAGMLRRPRVAKAGSDVWGQGRPCM